MMRWSTDVFACGFVVSDLSSEMSYNIYGVVVSNIFYILSSVFIFIPTWGNDPI